MYKCTYLLLFLLNILVINFTHARDSTALDHFTIKRFEDSNIDVYLSKPSNKKRKFAILLLLQGSGCASSTVRLFNVSNPWRDNVARLAIEKVGVKLKDDGKSCSSAYRQHNTIHQRLYDYIRVLQHFRKNAHWWNRKLYIIGGSEGGFMASLIAAMTPETKRIALMVTGGGMTLAEAIPITIERQMRSLGLPDSEIDKKLKETKDTFEKARQNPNPNILFGNISYKEWESILDIRPLNSMVDLTIPIYMAHGTNDNNMPVEAARMVDDRFRQLGKTNFQYIEYQGLDHGFIDQNGQSFFKEAAEAALTWLLTTKTHQQY